MVVRSAGTGDIMTPKLTPTGSKASKAGTNGKGSRRTKSWIEDFVKFTANIESPEIFRRWTAITTLAAVLEQKVWAWTTDVIYPNMYTFLVGHPGVGKSRTIGAARKMLETFGEGEFHIAPTDMTAASLVDTLKQAERKKIDPANGISEIFHSMLMMPDDWQVIMSSWKEDLIAALTTFYDVSIPFSQARRWTKEKKSTIKAPQLSILAGTTPKQLMSTMPEGSWEQGFASRTMFIFSDERIVGDSIFKKPEGNSDDLIHDLHIIHSLWGQLSNSGDFIESVDKWRKAGEPPRPNHPRLLHYNSRRLVHLLKLCIIACVDRGEKLIIDQCDFERAMKWLLEAEYFMPDIFKAGSGNADSKAMEEIQHFIQIQGRVLEEWEVMAFASKIIPVQSLHRLLDVMIRSNMIRHVGNNPQYGTGRYSASPLALPKN